MFKTDIGEFNGNSWEELCQICFAIKYEDEGYQKIPARFRGDMGIEGYTTRTGKVFQCYCPDIETTPKELYDKQRDKITTDLQKIQANQKKLAPYFNGTKIKEWILVTPRFDSKELIKHCRSKVIEYRSKRISLLDDQLEIFVHDIDFLAEQLPTALGRIEYKIEINPAQVEEKEITKWRGDEGELVGNAIRKFGALVPDNPDTKTRKVDDMTDRTIRRFLYGNQIIESWKEKFPERYEQFEDLIAVFEGEVEDRCAIFTGDKGELFNQIRSDLTARISDEFKDLNTVMVEKLSHLIVSRWVLICPINFD